jgi:hypothetical protein
MFKIRLTATLLIMLTVWGAFSTGCTKRPDSGEGNALKMSSGEAIKIMNAHVDELMAVPGVTAVAVGALDDGRPCILVYVVKKTADHNKLIPRELEGYRVVVEVSGEIKPMKRDGSR